MLNPLFWGILEVSSNYYGDSIGLAPIALGQKNIKKESKRVQWKFKGCRRKYYIFE